MNTLTNHITVGTAVLDSTELEKLFVVKLLNPIQSNWKQATDTSFYIEYSMGWLISQAV